MTFLLAAYTLGFAGLSICDMYTGRIVPGADLDGDMQIEYRTELEWEGEPYFISYLMDTRSEQGEWVGDIVNGFLSDLTHYDTYSVTVPKEYDGLALLFNSQEEYREQEIGVIHEEERYILDLWEDDSRLIRVSDLIQAEEKQEGEDDEIL